jgi:hypothetical protein
MDLLTYATALRADLETTTHSTNAAYAGGANGGFDDPLDARTAYLYHHFINRTLLTPYDYLVDANRQLDADAMQKAIWFIEQDDATPLIGKALDFYNEANTAVNTGAWTGLGDVRVLQLYTLNGVRTDYQDQLVIIPAPAAVALLGTAIAVPRRRRRA